MIVKEVMSSLGLEIDDELSLENVCDISEDFLKVALLC